MMARDFSSDNLDSLSVELLQSKGQAELLDSIDELRRLGFRRQVSLPQIVICGDQNCGKSSVFEAVTGVALPTDDGICTRFATEVVLRRSYDVKASVKIRPGANARPDHRAKLGAFTRSHNWVKDIPKLFSEAKLIMGLTDDGKYSEDVLQLEVAGPSLPNIKVIDLPGLLSSPGENQTKQDVALVRKMTESYMNDARNIVLAVVSAESPLSRQNILHLTQHCCSRTMGVITKPDTLDPGSSEDSFYARVKNQDTPLQLGWHVLRNAEPGQQKSRKSNRDDVERLFFSTTEPWKALSPNSLGASALRSRLSKILLDQIDTQLSTLSSDISKELEINRSLLNQLGPSRDTKKEQRIYLTHIAEEFQFLTRFALLGQYHDPYFRYNPQTSFRRLRSVVRNWAEEFAEDMESRGHSYHIYDDSETYTRPADLTSDDPQPVARSAFISGLAELLKQSKGGELRGLVNAQVVGELFIRYSLKWSTMARAHVFEVWKRVKRFLDDLLHHIAGASVGDAILREILDQEMGQRLEKLYEKVDELIAPYKRVIPSTLNRQLAARIQRLRKAPSSQKAGDGDESDLAICSEVLDCMQAYYDVALSVFIDNISGLAVESCLVEGLEQLISPSRVAKMSNQELESFAGDSEDAELSRKQLSETVRVLEGALAACRRCETVAREAAPENYCEPLKAASIKHNSASSTADSSTSVSTPATDTKGQSEIPASASSERPRSHSSSSILGSFPLPNQSPNGQSSERSSGEMTGRSRTESVSPPLKVSPPPKSPARTQSLNSGTSARERAPRLSKHPNRKRISKAKPQSPFEDKTPWTASPIPNGKNPSYKVSLPVAVNALL